MLKTFLLSQPKIKDTFINRFTKNFIAHSEEFENADLQRDRNFQKYFSIK